MTGKRRAGRDPVAPTEQSEAIAPGPAASPPADPEPAAAEAAPPPAPAAPPAMSSGGTVVFAPPPTRRELRRQRRARRRKLGAAGLAGVIALGLGIAAVVAFGVHKAVTHNSAPSRHQTTMLLQIQAPDRTAAVSVLLAHDSGTHQGVELLVPSRLEANVCGYGTEPFGNVLGQANGVAESRQALTTELDGVTVDGSWVLTEAQLAALVDKVGGVTVPVDTNVIGQSGNSNVLLVPKSAGGSHLSGTQAAAYATYVASKNEDQSAQLARAQLVIDALIRKLPSSQALIASYLRGLGTSAQPTFGAAKAAELLAGIAADDQRNGGVLPTDVPVDPLDSGGPPAYSVDHDKVAALVQQQFAPSLSFDAAHAVTVQLLNGVGTPGLVQTACPRLSAHGFVFAGSGNAPSFNNPKSSVQVPSDNQAAIGSQVAKALGLPDSDVERQRVPTSVATVVVILGRDYKP